MGNFEKKPIFRLKSFLKKYISYRRKVKKIPDSKYHKRILKGDEANEAIADAIKSGEPKMISRIGSVELSILEHYIKKRKDKNKPRIYTDEIKYYAKNNAGVFPKDDELLDKFSVFFLESLKNTDMLGVWNNPFEDYICLNYCKEKILIDQDSLYPYLFKNPWSQFLENKKVLVIHPFEETIKKQYLRNKHIFENRKILPNFELKTIKAIQTNASQKTDYTSWFEVYEYLCSKINEADFDVAIIGAGSYGLPLSSYIKTTKKKISIHMGGGTQILFGIKGKRWDNMELINNLYTESWVRPLESEKPNDHKRIEDGCYW